MKRILSLIFCIIMLFSVSCSSSLAVEETKGNHTESVTCEEEEKTEEKEKDTAPISIPEGFSVGYAKATVNPGQGVGLGGYGNETTRLSRVQVDDLYLTCTAVSDGENVVFIFSSDTIHVARTTAEGIGKQAEKLYGVPAENVIMNGTHSHSTPAMANLETPGLSQYLKKYVATAKDLMGKALRDLDSATIQVGEKEAVGFNYVRRYVSLVDGSYLGKNLPAGQDPAKVAHESDADHKMRLIVFDRETKKDVVLVNWQAHPTKVGGSDSTDVSADYIGVFRKTVEKEGYLFSFHQGASGNVTPASRIQGNPNYYESHITYGEKLGEIALDTIKAGLTPAASGKVQAKMEEYTATRKNGGKQEGVNLTVLSIGDVAFATAPCELHDTLGVEIREKSPFAFTFFCGYTNGRIGYIPAAFAIPNGGYEVESCHYIDGTGEAIAGELVRLLNDIFATR